MPRARRIVRVPALAADYQAWTAAARAEGLTVAQWLAEAARLAIARGSTR